MSEIQPSFGLDWDRPPSDTIEHPADEPMVLPLKKNYATEPIYLGFDWPEILEMASTKNGILPGQEIYLVVFRSKLKQDADVGRLAEADDLALLEAQQADGYIQYFKGSADAEGNCLSFCLWMSREHAIASAGGPMHAAAAELAAEMYENQNLERWSLRQAVGTNNAIFREIVLPSKEEKSDSA
jgi:hypothetical protein